VRSAMNPQIMPRHLAQYLPLFNEVSDSLVSVFEDLRKPDGTVEDIYKYLYLVRWTMEGKSIY